MISVFSDRFLACNELEIMSIYREEAEEKPSRSTTKLTWEPQFIRAFESKMNIFFVKT